MAKYTTPEEFWNSVNISKDSECWEWLGCRASNGYGKVYYQKRTYTAHRIAYFVTFNIILPPTQCICHTCDNRICCNPSHLFVGSNKDNSYDMIKKQRQARGESQGLSRLTADNVIYIRDMYSKGISMYALAKQLTVNKGTISAVIKRKTWKHIP